MRDRLELSKESLLRILLQKPSNRVMLAALYKRPESGATATELHLSCGVPESSALALLATLDDNGMVWKKKRESADVVYFLSSRTLKSLEVLLS